MRTRHKSLAALSGVALLTMTSGCSLVHLVPAGAAGGQGSSPTAVQTVTATPSTTAAAAQPSPTDTSAAASATTTAPTTPSVNPALVAMIRTEGAAVDYATLLANARRATVAEGNFKFQFQSYEADKAEKNTEPLYTAFASVNDLHSNTADMDMEMQTAGKTDFTAVMVDGSDTAFKKGGKGSAQRVPAGKENKDLKLTIDFARDPLWALPDTMTKGEKLVYKGSYTEKGQTLYQFDVAGVPPVKKRAKDAIHLWTFHVDSQMRVRYYATTGGMVFFLDDYGTVKDL